MTIPRIIKIEEPPKNERTFHGGLYRVWVEEEHREKKGFTFPTSKEKVNDWDYMFKAQIDLLKFENEMLQADISEEMIEKHRELVIDHVQDEQAMDGECE